MEWNWRLRLQMVHYVELLQILLWSTNYFVVVCLNVKKKYAFFYIIILFFIEFKNF